MDTPPEYRNKPNYPVRAIELDQLRQERGLSLERLAKKAKIHIKTLNRILAGQKARLSTIHLLAETLGVSCDHLRADIPRKEDEHPTPFSLGIAIDGELRSSSQAIDLFSSPPVLKQHLTDRGITITGLATNLQLADASATNVRTIMFIYGFLTSGKPYWSFVAVSPRNYQQMLAAQQEGTLDLLNFHAYGEEILSGEGNCHLDTIVPYLAERFHASNPRELRFQIHPDVVREHGPLTGPEDK